MLIVFFRACILYIIIVLIMRLMGKRQIGQLQPSELVVALVIADLAAVPMGNMGVPLVNGIIPILTLFVLEELLSYISLKSEKARGILCGTPSILIEKGLIIENELKRLRFNLNDLLEQLRLKGYTNIEDIEYAILETEGLLSVIPKSDKKNVTPKDLNLKPEYEGLPITVILDGRINERNIEIAGLSTDWLIEELRKLKIESKKDVFFAYITPDRKLHYQMKLRRAKQTINIS